MILDWKNIRPLNGGRDKGFEELCAQLARAERPPGSTFVRKGSPDAGVECYAILNDGTEWGWQAKYFDLLGDAQWSQIDDSIETALAKHPKLVRYFVCVPLDRPDARIEGRKSAKERWNEHVAKWSSWAGNRGMAVEFLYWGSHELLERLARSEHVGRVRFWFDFRGFDAAWFTSRLEEAVRTAGPRYTPEVHVDLPIAEEFEAFGRTERFFEREKGNARRIRDKLRLMGYSQGGSDPTIDAKLTEVSSKVQAVLTALGAIEGQPTGPLLFKPASEQARAADEAADELLRLLEERERDFDTKQEAIHGNRQSWGRSNPFRDRRIRLFNLTTQLEAVQESLNHGDAIASSTLMLLLGAAGTGKTHLLCDVARHRLDAGRPTVLLMGQRFVSNDPPWSQALQQLDLAGLSAEEFVGALEAAAQAAGSRALLMIDGINEGTGRVIWPTHLAAFLAQLERSPWIGLVLAVRSSYEAIVVPEDVLIHASTVRHQGFMEHEYDATKTFFIHYGLELPSTPLLAPEFRNPLFLKTLCRGLNAKGERRLPRGFHGVTAVFDLYLSEVNQRLASTLGFHPRTRLVPQALEAVTTAALDAGESWLSLTKAAEIVNSFLPGRDFERSLYRGLIAEGVLIEEAARHDDAKIEEVVFIAYERFSDHLGAKTLLDRHLDIDAPATAFAQEGPLALICDERQYVSPGLLEALCIQIPERTGGRELMSIAPSCVNRWGLGDAFRQSLVWRAYAAFSDDTYEAMDKLCLSQHDVHDTLDVLLTVATLPGHPLNARFLGGRLRKDDMPERDAWWSLYLHEAWGTHGAVDRLVDWASSVSASASIDEEATDLCALALGWMLAASNRFLRDRATTALVSLLTGRLEAARRLVEQFTDIDDPYIAERVYAVAYGVAMRCHDPVAVSGLATAVYSQVFAAGSPPQHILLRDYARGVVERALHLRSPIDVVAERIRPPYKSTWPTIPTAEDIKPLLSDWSTGSHDSGELQWARNRIAHSVMDDDFARYVIGTNSSSTSRYWLSLTLDEPSWKPPPRPEDEIRSFVSELSPREHVAWDSFEVADNAYGDALRSFVLGNLVARSTKDDYSENGDDSRSERVKNELETKRTQALAALKEVLTPDQAQRLEEILAAKENYFEARRPPGFDLRLIQRYVLWRTFDLGWTTDRFGHFDRFAVSINGREASKAERMGKKYQWIAYHEIMALIADHFQYRERFGDEEGVQKYDGPWQLGLRDIDPSCTIRSVPGGTTWGGHATAWWAPAEPESWGDPHRPRDWVMDRNDLPKVDELLIVTDPADRSRWLNCQGFFQWTQQLPADRESSDVEHRQVWYMCTGYLLRAEDAESFLKWAEGVDFWGRWMPEPPEVHEMFLGEYAWAPASAYFEQQYYRGDGWVRPDHDCPVNVRSVAFQYLREASGFDCSIDEGYRLRLPVNDLLAGCGVRWSGRGADFTDAADRVVAQDPTVHGNGANALLIREDLLRGFLNRKKLTICWTILGEKQVLSPGLGLSGPYYPSLRMSGARVLVDVGTQGFLQDMIDNPNSKC